VYGSYWNRINERWGTRRLDEPTPSEINQLAEHLKVNVTVRRNARGDSIAATTGNDPALDALLLRLHTETAADAAARSRSDRSIWTLTSA
jgi:hypothetical protein